MRNRLRNAAPDFCPHTGAGPGFTLIELMVVIALIGIAAAMIVPEVKNSYEDALLRSASRELVDTFQLAYSRAVSLNQTHRVRIEEGSGNYAVEAPLEQSAGMRQSSASTTAGLLRTEADTEFRPLKELRGYTGKLDSRIRVQVRLPEETGEDPLATPASDSPELAEIRSLMFYGDGTAAAREVLLQDRQGFGVLLSLNPITARVKITRLARK